MILDGTNEVSNPAGFRLLDPAALIGIAIHHTVTSISTEALEEEERAHIRSIDVFHASRGWGGCGYHMLAFPSGRTYHVGDGQRAHVARRNHELIGIAAVGDLSTTSPSDSLIAQIREAITWARERWGPLPEVKGHSTWGTATACPGSLSQIEWDLLPPPPPEDFVTEIIERWASGREQVFRVTPVS